MATYKRTVLCIGAGYVGGPTMAVVAAKCPEYKIHIVDINAEKEITLENLHTAQEFSPELGMKLKGWAECTILRGQVVFEKGRVAVKPGNGQFIKRPVKLHY